MEHKSNAVKEALLALDQLEASLSSEERIDDPPILASKMSAFQSALCELFQEGKSMDAAALTPIPVPLLEVLDQPVRSNPDIYKICILQEANQNAENLKQKLVSLASIKRGVEQNISGCNAGSSSADTSSGAMDVS